MHQKLGRNKPYAKKISKIRSATVEPVLGTLINFLNMRKINARGMAQANKHVLMAALTYNLKKYLKFERKTPTIKAQEMPKMVENILASFKTVIYAFHILFLSLAKFSIAQAGKITKTL